MVHDDFNLILFSDGYKAHVSSLGIVIEIVVNCIFVSLLKSFELILILLWALKFAMYLI